MKKTSIPICMALAVRCMVVLLLSIYSAVSFSQQARSLSAEGARVYFIEPHNGAELPLEFTVKFGLSGMGVAPSGVVKNNTGHHHLLIDLDVLPNLDASLPANKNIKHFGGGQTEVTLKLSAGEHSLQLLLGDQLHRPHNPVVVSEKITIIVKDNNVQVDAH